MRGSMREVEKGNVNVYSLTNCLFSTLETVVSLL
jgi:hypothetical protein